jgi:hypothetical protein
MDSKIQGSIEWTLRKILVMKAARISLPQVDFESLFLILCAHDKLVFFPIIFVLFGVGRILTQPWVFVRFSSW